MRQSLSIGLMVLAVVAWGCKRGPGHSGSKQLLGKMTVNGYELTAYQSGPIEDGELDVVITGGAGKPRAVRFWVGAASESDSAAKAVATEESTNQWHTHPKIPKPLPADAQFLVEVEPPSGATFKVAFDVKR